MSRMKLAAWVGWLLILSCLPCTRAARAQISESTPEVLWSLADEPDLKAEADALATPVAIYEFARNETEFSLYQGSRSSSINTFLARRGNDVDLASMLIAMLRSQGTPARYATAVVRLDASRLLRWLGVRDLDLAASLMDDQGIQGVQIAGDRSTVDFEHVWVQALIPFDLHRGAGPVPSVDCNAQPGACTWVDLDPSFKEQEVRAASESIDVDPVVDFDYEAYYNARNDGFVAADGIDRRDKNPLEIYEEEILAYLRANDPGRSLEDVRFLGPVVRDEAGLLPSSLPFAVVGPVTSYDSVAAHDAAVDPDWTRSLTLRVRFGTAITFSGPTFPLAELSTRRLTLVYELGSPNRMVARLDGVEVWNPLTAGSVVVDGQVVDLGFPFTLEIDLDGAPATVAGEPDEVISVAYPDCVVGGYFLVASGGETSNWSQVHRAAGKLLQANRDFPIVEDPNTAQLYVDQNGNGYDASDPLLLDDFDAQDALTGGLLDTAQALYYARLRDAARRLGDLNHVVTPISGFVGVVSTTDQVDYLDGTPFSIMPAGLLIDMKGIRVNGSWRVDAAAEYSNEQFELLGTIGSALEHEVWQELTGFEALSTMSGFQRALAEGTPLLNPGKIGGIETVSASYPAFGLDTHEPPGIVRHNWDLFGRRPRTYTVASGSAEFDVFKAVIDETTLSYLTAWWRVQASEPSTDGYLRNMHDLIAYFDPIEQQMIDKLAAGQSFTWTSACQTGDFSDQEALDEAERCFFDLVDNAFDGKAYLRFFDRNKAFNNVDYVYRESPRSDLNQHSTPFLAQMRNNLLALGSVAEREYRIPALKTFGNASGGAFYRFQVWVDRLFDAASGHLASLGFQIRNDFFGAGGGYVNGDEVLAPATSLLSFDNDVFTDRNLIAVVNNDRIRTPSTSDPISTVTGNMYLDETDLAIRGRGLDLVFTRTYNSGASALPTGDQPLGPGWTHSWAMKLVSNDYGRLPNADVGAAPENENGLTSSITYVDERGGEHNYEVDDTGASPTYAVSPPRGDFHTLLLDEPSAGFATLTFRNGNRYVFEGPDLRVPGSTARLARIEDPFGNRLTFSYDASGRLIGVSDGLPLPGRSAGITLDYDGAGRLSQVSDWSGRAWIYGYDGAGRLASATDPLDHTTSYTYAADTGLLETAILPADRDGDGTGDVRSDYTYYRNRQAFTNANALGEGEVVDYDVFRKRTRVTDPRGAVREFSYDQSGVLTKLREPDGGIHLFAHTPDLLRYQKIDGLGERTRYSYRLDRTLDGQASDSFGNVTREEDPLGYTVDTDYGIYDQPTRVVDENGHALRMVYYASSDAAAGALAGKLERVEAEQLGALTDVALQAFEYNADGSLRRKIEWIDPAQPARTRTTTYSYDAAHLNVTEVLVEGSDGTSIRRSYEYDSLGRRTREVLYRRAAYDDPTLLELATDTEYDARDRVTLRRDPLGIETRSTYDDNGNLVKQEMRYPRPNGTFASRTTSRVAYDAADRKVGETDVLGHTVTTAYDEAGNPIRRTSPLGHSIRYEYDSMNRLVRTIDENGHSSSVGYDLAGRPVVETDALGQSITRQYDAAGRLLAESDPLGHTTRFEYDGVGHVVRTIDANAEADPSQLNSLGATEYSEYDELGRRIRRVDAEDGETLFGYDLLGNLVSLRDAEGHLTRFEYDDLGRLVRRYDPLVEAPDRFTSFTTDEAGNRIERTDRNGERVVWVYDAGNRLTETRLLASGETETRGYNLFGDLVSLANPEVTYTFSYDEKHRLLTKKDGRTAKKLQLTWDADGRLAARKDYEGGQTDYLYDETGRLVGETNPDFLQISYRYDPAGRLIDRVLSNGVTTRYTWDAASRLKTMESRTADGTLVYQVTTLRDAVGNLLTTNGTGGLFGYSYDRSHRLLSALQVPGTLDVQYAYDGVGNRLSETRSGVTQAYVHDADNRLLEIHAGTPGGPLLTRFAYDHEGRTLSEEDGSGTPLASYTWDELGRMRTATREGLSLAFAYDPLGYRIGKTGPSGTLRYLLDGEHLDSVHDVADQVVARYLRGSVIDEIVNAYERDTQGDLVNLSYHGNGLQSVVGLSGHTGTVEAQLSYEPFGEALGGSAPSPVALRYTGRELDPETGLYHYRARYYDPRIGRFMSEDPLGFDSGDVNFYAYVGNDPVNGSDPTGLTKSHRDRFGMDRLRAETGDIFYGELSFGYQLGGEIRIEGVPVGFGLDAGSVHFPYNYNGQQTPYISAGSTLTAIYKFESNWTAPLNSANLGRIDRAGADSLNPLIDMHVEMLNILKGQGVHSRSIGYGPTNYSGDFTTDFSVYAPIGAKLGINWSEALDLGATAASMALEGIGRATEQWMGLPEGTFVPGLSVPTGAAGGFVLYPSSPNFNSASWVYRK